MPSWECWVCMGAEYFAIWGAFSNTIPAANRFAVDTYSISVWSSGVLIFNLFKAQGNIAHLQWQKMIDRLWDPYSSKLTRHGRTKIVDMRSSWSCVLVTSDRHLDAPEDDIWGWRGYPLLGTIWTCWAIKKAPQLTAQIELRAVIQFQEMVRV